VPWWRTIRAYAGGAAGVGVIIALVMGSRLFQIPSGQASQLAFARVTPAASLSHSSEILTASSPDQFAAKFVRPRLLSPLATPVVPSTESSRATPDAIVSVAVPPDSAVAATNANDVTPTSRAVALGSTVPGEIRRWESLILKYAVPLGLDPNLVAAVMMTESGGNPNATSSKGAIGLMQVVGGSYDPETNVRQGTRILANDLGRFNGDVELALSAYNAGAHAVDTYSGVPPYLETENYVFEVLNRYYLYSPTS